MMHMFSNVIQEICYVVIDWTNAHQEVWVGGYGKKTTILVSQKVQSIEVRKNQKQMLT